MKFTDIEQLRTFRFLNNLDVVEKSLYNEFEVGRIDDAQLTNLLRGIAEQRKSLYKVMEAISAKDDAKQPGKALRNFRPQRGEGQAGAYD